MTSPAENRSAHTALVAAVARQTRHGCARWSRTLPRPSCRAREAATARPCRRVARCGQSVTRNRAVGCRRDVRRRVSRGRHHHRNRQDLRTRMHGRGQRRHGQRWYLLPDYGQEAPAGPGDRGTEPAALHLSGRLRWCIPAASRRGFPGPRSLRPDLLQPSQSQRARHPADRRGARIVHGRRRIRSGDERRSGHRP